MAATSDAAHLPPWARGELAPGALCASPSHSRAHPVKAKAVVTEWFGEKVKAAIGWRNIDLPYPVCGRHLNEAQRSWEKITAKRKALADREANARELTAALSYFRESTGLALEAGLDERYGKFSFTLNATQLRHLADAMPRAVQGQFPYWQHQCGHIEAFTAEQLEEIQGGCDACESGSDDPTDWQPLYTRRQAPEVMPGNAEAQLADVIQFPGGRY